MFGLKRFVSSVAVGVVAIAFMVSSCGQAPSSSATRQSTQQTIERDAQSLALAATAASLAPAAGTQMAVLVPDGMELTDPSLLVWADAAWEEGLALVILSDSDFVALGAAALEYPGIILPDIIHPTASDALISALTAYASAGGYLMLVYDFGALTPGGFFAVPKSRLSDLAGIDYLFYDALLDKTVGLGAIAGESSVLRELQVPPGKSIPVTTSASASTTASLRGLSAGSLSLKATPASPRSYLSASSADPGGLAGYLHASQFVAPQTSSATSSKSPLARKVVASARALAMPAATATATATATTSSQEAISGYVYGALTYPAYVTADASAYNGTVLLNSAYGYTTATGQTTSSGVAVGLHYYGSGGVLFVNTPLAYLKGRTDGMLMHGLLQYLAEQLKLPRLSDHPSGIGGLVFNWHMDAAEALPYIQTLDSQHVWDQGPFSIHFTAGPDCDAVGDGLGLNVPGNSTTRSWITYLLGKKHNVGSHGGWDHNLYGQTATDYNADQLVQGSTTDTYRDFLGLNKQAMEAAMGSSVIEYSAPQGNNPLWAMSWLEANGHVAYYFTGDTGLGPTRAYRPPLDNSAVGTMVNPAMWAFPVTPFGVNATFEEFQTANISDASIIAWYTALIDFAVANRTSRLIYAHPPGASSYPAVLSALFAHASALAATGQFKWYTMAELAQFEARRLNVSWVESGTQSQRVFVAQHPTDLSGFTWLLPKSAYYQPAVQEGTATVSSDAQNWLVVAEGGTTLTFVSARL